MMKRPLLLGIVLFTTVGCGPKSQSPGHGADVPSEVPVPVMGEVDLVTSCATEANDRFRQGLMALHHMWFTRAKTEFKATLEADPNCSMGHWGEAMLAYRPLRKQPTDQVFQSGIRAVAAARAGSANELEKKYIDAIAAYFDPPDGTPHKERAEASREEWKQLHESEVGADATAFYALALIATAPLEDTELEQQQVAGQLMAELLAQRPKHPGGFHYLIHAYDFPKLAPQAASYADRYGELAPDVAHALHMPSHIYTRLGNWPKSIAWNIRSLQAARKESAGGPHVMDYYHALDYLTYAYLQSCDDAAAQEMSNLLAGASHPHHVDRGTLFGASSLNIRIAVEHERWAELSKLELPALEGVSWEEWPRLSSMLDVAHGVAFVHIDQLDNADQVLRKLEADAENPVFKDDPFWSQENRVFQGTLRALLLEKRGKVEKAIEAIAAAAAMQNEIGKMPVNPGFHINASLLYGQMLARHGRPSEASQALAVGLESEPNRYSLLAEALSVAKVMGHAAAIDQYASRLQKVCSGPSAKDRDGWQQAQHHHRRGTAD